MDRPIDPGFKRRQFVRRVLLSGLGLGLAGVLFVYLPGWIKPSLDRDRIRTARVERGPVEATITASGVVVPEVEQVISSPISTRLVRVLERPGARLVKGQPIVELDLSESVLAVENLSEQLALKQNQQAQRRLDLEEQLSGLDTRWRLKSLEQENLQSKVAQTRQLLELGAMSKEDVRKVEMDVERAGIELEQIEDEQRNARKAVQVQLEGLALEMRILERDREEARRQMDLAQIRADREGVLTWVIPQEGVAVGQGEVVARMADLSSFRVQATVSDVHAGRLAAGLPVRVRVGEDEYLEGRISRVLPTVENGVVNLEVSLEDRSNPRLRPNLRVDVYVVTERRDQALRVEKGPSLGGSGEQQVFVVRGGVAIRTRVQLGISGFDYCEVVEGLQEGDEVVLSDMREYVHIDKIDIRR